MIVFTWNIRGLNQGHKQKEIKLFLTKNKVDIFWMLRLKEDKTDRIKRKIAQGWASTHNYTKEANGRIWVLWRSHLKVQILEIHEQYIHTMVEDPIQISLYTTIVYARNEVQKKETLWADLMNITLQHQMPWVISGDTNSVLG